jgi:hypothetical protein
MTKAQASMLNDPYVLVVNPEGRFLVLNRYYKPLGFTTAEVGWFDYRDVPAIPLPINAVRQVSVNNAPDPCTSGHHCYWLYDDATSPRLSAHNARLYWQKLHELVRALTPSQAEEIVHMLFRSAGISGGDKQ